MSKPKTLHLVNPIRKDLAFETTSDEGKTMTVTSYKFLPGRLELKLFGPNQDGTDLAFLTLPFSELDLTAAGASQPVIDNIKATFDMAVFEGTPLPELLKNVA